MGQLIEDALRSRGYDPAQWDIDDNGNVIKKAPAQPTTNESPDHYGQLEKQTGVFEAFARGAAEAVIPTGVGMAAGGAIGKAGLAKAHPVAAILAPLAGGIAASMGTAAVQNQVLGKVAPEFRKRSEQAYTEHPVATALGSFAGAGPYMSMRNSAKVLGEAGKGLARIREFGGKVTSSEANALLNVGLGSAVQGGMEGVRQIQEGDLDLGMLALNLAGGAAINEPRKWTKIMGLSPTDFNDPTRRAHWKGGEIATGGKSVDVDPSVIAEEKAAAKIVADKVEAEGKAKEVAREEYLNKVVIPEKEQRLQELAHLTEISRDPYEVRQARLEITELQKQIGALRGEFPVKDIIDPSLGSKARQKIESQAAKLERENAERLKGLTKGTDFEITTEKPVDETAKLTEEVGLDLAIATPEVRAEAVTKARESLYSLLAQRYMAVESGDNVAVEKLTGDINRAKKVIENFGEKKPTANAIQPQRVADVEAAFKADEQARQEAKAKESLDVANKVAEEMERRERDFNLLAAEQEATKQRVAAEQAKAHSDALQKDWDAKIAARKAERIANEQRIAAEQKAQQEAIKNSEDFAALNAKIDADVKMKLAKEAADYDAYVANKGEVKPPVKVEEALSPEPIGDVAASRKLYEEGQKKIEAEKAEQDRIAKEEERIAREEAEAAKPENRLKVIDESLAEVTAQRKAIASKAAVDKKALAEYKRLTAEINELKTARKDVEGELTEKPIGQKPVEKSPTQKNLETLAEVKKDIKLVEDDTKYQEGKLYGVPELDTMHEAQLAKAGKPREQFVKWVKDSLAKIRGVEIRAVRKVIGSKGQEVYGKSAGNKAEVSVEKGEVDTWIHETFHPFLESLLNSTSKTDRTYAERMLKQLADTKEFGEYWKAAHGVELPKEFTPIQDGVAHPMLDEFITQLVGDRGVEKIFLEKDGLRKSWRDFWSHMKTRLSTGSREDISRVFTNMLFNKPLDSDIVYRGREATLVTPSGEKEQGEKSFDQMRKAAGMTDEELKATNEKVANRNEELSKTGYKVARYGKDGKVERIDDVGPEAKYQGDKPVKGWSNELDEKYLAAKAAGNVGQMEWALKNAYAQSIYAKHPPQDRLTDPSVYGGWLTPGGRVITVDEARHASVIPKEFQWLGNAYDRMFGLGFVRFQLGGKEVHLEGNKLSWGQQKTIDRMKQDFGIEVGSHLELEGKQPELETYVKGELIPPGRRTTWDFKGVDRQGEDMFAYTPKGKDGYKYQGDQEYLKLAQDPEGNKKELQRMVDEAAKKSGYMIGPVWHSTDKGNFNVFQQQPISFTGGEGTFGHFGSLRQAEKLFKNTREFADWANSQLSSTKENKINPSLRSFYLKADKIHRVQDDPSWASWGLQADTARKRGFDMLVYKNKVEGSGDSYVPLNSPNQIKSADPITYDDNGNIIPLPERFNTESNDIRYQGDLPPTSPADYYTRIGSAWLKPVRSTIDKIAANGDKTHQYGAERLRRMGNEATHLYGQYGNKLIEQVTRLIKSPVEIAKGTSDSVDKVYKYMQEERDRVPHTVELVGDEVDVHAKLREIIVAMQQEQLRDGPNVKYFDKDKKEWINRAPISDPMYIMHSLDDGVLDILNNRRGSQEFKDLYDEYINYHMGKGLTRDQVVEQFRNIFESKGGEKGLTFNALRLAEGAGLPPSWRQKSFPLALRRYAQRHAADLAYYRHIQKDPRARTIFNEIDDGKTIGKATNVDEVDGEALYSIRDSDEVKSIFRQITHDYPFSEAKLNALNRLIKSGMMQTVTGIRDVIATPFIAMENLKPTELPLMLEAALKVKEGYKKGYDEGVIRRGTTAWQDFGESNKTLFIDNISNLINKVTGREALEQFARAYTMELGRLVAESRKGSGDTEFFDRFGPPDWQAKMEANANEVLDFAAARFVEANQGTYDYRGLPAYALEGQLAPFLSLAKWSTERLNNFDKAVIQEAKKGNLRPFVMATIGAVIGGEAIQAAVEYINDKKPEQLTWSEFLGLGGKDAAYRYAAIASASGYAGILGDLTKSGLDLYHGTEARGLTFPLVDAAAEAFTRFGQAAEAARDGEKGIYPELALKLINDNIQLSRVISNATASPEEKTRKADMRDLRLYERIEENKVSNKFGEANPFRGNIQREFKRELEPTKIVEKLPEVLAEAFKRAGNDPYKLKRELINLKMAGQRIMPSISESPISFASYLLYLRKTQGDEAVAQKLQRYIKSQVAQDLRSDIIPSI
jgi:hypothetical protein